MHLTEKPSDDLPNRWADEGKRMIRFIFPVIIAILMSPHLAISSTEVLSLENTNLSFDVPNKWKIIQRKETGSASFVVCERDPMDVDGFHVSATFLVMLQKIDNQKVGQEAFHTKALQMPGLSVTSEVPANEKILQIPGKEVLGKYIDKRGFEHKVYVFDSLIEGGQGVIVLVDGLEKMFAPLDSEYRQILRAISLINQMPTSVQNERCSKETPIIPVALLGTWQSMDEPFKDQHTYSNDGTYTGFVEDNGQVTWRYTGKWNLNGTKLHEIFTQSSLERIPIGTEDVSEILSIRCGVMTYRSTYLSSSGKISRYKKISDGG